MKDQQRPRKLNQATDEERDPIISKLLMHLQEMRESVPINYRLKQDLKKRLLEQMKQMNMTNVEIESTKPMKNNRKRLSIIMVVVGVFLAIMLFIGLKTDVSIAKWQQLSIPSMDPMIDADLSPKDDRIVLLSQSHLSFYNKEGDKENTISLPSAKGKIVGIEWSPLGHEVAWVVTDDHHTSVWLTNIGTNSSRLVWQGSPTTYDGMDWSTPDWLLASLGEEVWKISTVSSEMTLAFTGTEPSGSPNGELIALHHGGEIEVWDRDGKLIRKVGKGQHPVWIENDFLFFVDERGDTAVVHPVAEKMKVKKGPALHGEGKILFIRLSDDRKRVLVGRVQSDELHLWKGQVRK